MDLESVADELYAVSPAGFTDARSAAVAAAKAAKDPSLANQIGKLRKPTQAAWLVNLLVRERPGDVDGLLELGDQLRAAQEALDGEEIRRLTGRRRRTVADLAKEVRRLAADLGETVSAAVGRDVDATLEAALADPAAAAALVSGRLTKSMTYAGFGTVDLGDVVATPTAVTRPSTRPPAASKRAAATPARRTPEKAQGKGSGKASPQTDEKARAKAKLFAAREDLTTTAAEADAADAALAAAERDLRVAEEHRDDLDRRIAELETELSAARREVSETRRRRDKAAKAAEAAGKRRDTAQVRVNVLEA